MFFVAFVNIVNYKVYMNKNSKKTQENQAYKQPSRHK